MKCWEVTTGSMSVREKVELNSPLQPGLVNLLRYYIIPIDLQIPQDLHVYDRRELSQLIKGLLDVRDKCTFGYILDRR